MCGREYIVNADDATYNDSVYHGDLERDYHANHHPDLVNHHPDHDAYLHQDDHANLNANHVVDHYADYLAGPGGADQPAERPADRRRMPMRLQDTLE